MFTNRKKNNMCICFIFFICFFFCSSTILIFEITKLCARVPVQLKYSRRKRKKKKKIISHTRKKASTWKWIKYTYIYVCLMYMYLMSPYKVNWLKIDYRLIDGWLRATASAALHHHRIFKLNVSRVENAQRTYTFHFMLCIWCLLNTYAYYNIGDHYCWKWIMRCKNKMRVECIDGISDLARAESQSWLGFLDKWLWLFNFTRKLCMVCYSWK